jgi:hypothetical protein
MHSHVHLGSVHFAPGQHPSRLLALCKRRCDGLTGPCRAIRATQAVPETPLVLSSRDWSGLISSSIDEFDGTEDLLSSVSREDEIGAALQAAGRDMDSFPSGASLSMMNRTLKTCFKRKNWLLWNCVCKSAHLNRLLIDIVLASDFSSALGSGKVSLDVLNRFLSMESNSLLGPIFRIQAFRERLLADPSFLVKVGIEVCDSSTLLGTGRLPSGLRRAEVSPPPPLSHTRAQ